MPVVNMDRGGWNGETKPAIENKFASVRNLYYTEVDSPDKTLNYA